MGIYSDKVYVWNQLRLPLHNLVLFTASVVGLACPSPAGDGVLFSCVAVDMTCYRHALGDLSYSLSLKKASLKLVAFVEDARAIFWMISAHSSLTGGDDLSRLMITSLSSFSILAEHSSSTPSAILGFLGTGGDSASLSPSSASYHYEGPVIHMAHPQWNHHKCLGHRDYALLNRAS